MRKLVNYKNPILKEKSSVIAEDEDIANLLVDMDKIGTVFHAYGISAVQLGELKQVFLFRDSANENFNVAINPKLLSISEIGTTVLEGCLSYPNVSIPVSRPFSCKVSFENQAREVVEKELSGLMARVWLHEFSHLHGQTITDNISLLKQEIITKKIKKWQKKVDPKGTVYEAY